MSIDLTAMRRGIRRPLGVDEDDPELTNDDIDLFLNRAFWEVQDKFPFREKERIGTFVTQIGVRNYEMPKPFESLQSLAIVDPVSGRHTPLDKMEDYEYESVYVEGATNYGAPEKYMREDCFARMWPTPDALYTIVVRRKIVLSDLSASNLNTNIPQVWDEIIQFGGLWRAFFDAGDFARANQVKAHQVSLINTITPVEVKELGDTSRAGMEVFGREY